MSNKSLSAEHVRIIKGFADDTGAFRATREQASALAAACAAVLALNEAIAAAEESA